MKSILIALLLTSSTLAFADSGCITGDKFSRNKVIHFGGTALVSGIGTYVTGNPWIGFAAGMTIGLVREKYKMNHPGMHCEYSAIAYDIAGSATGAFITDRFILLPQKKGVYVAYSKEF